METAKLAEQLTLAFRIIDRIDATVTAQQIVIDALLASHPAKNVLAELLSELRERSIAQAIQHAIPDPTIDAIHMQVDRVLADLGAQPQAGDTSP